MKQTKAEQIEYDIAQVAATMAMENLILTKENKQTLRECFNGEKSFDEARKEAIAKHSVSQRR